MFHKIIPVYSGVPLHRNTLRVQKRMGILYCHTTSILIYSLHWTMQLGFSDIQRRELKSVKHIFISPFGYLFDCMNSLFLDYLSIPNLKPSNTDFFLTSKRSTPVSFGGWILCIIGWWSRDLNFWSIITLAGWDYEVWVW